MAVIKLAAFNGENRALHPTLLNEALGVQSLNQKSGRGDLRPWNAPLNVATVPAGRQTIYRMGRDVASDTQYWLSWPTVVHAVRAGDATDTAERTYYTGDGTPKWTDTTKALAAAPYPTSSRELGVPAPASAPLLSAAGGVSETIETRFYTSTFVSDAGEESAPGPVSLALVCKADDTVTLTALAAAPAGAYGITMRRIYRTDSDSSGSAEFFFLREIASGLTGTTDDNRDLGEVMPTTTWLMPPADLKWLTGLWNGMMAGISGRSVRLCEANTYYAWPIAYEILPAEVTPVALATFGQTLVVLTNGAPLIVTGGSPDAMDEQPSGFLQACVAPLSAVGMGPGVVWASPDGLCYLGGDGARVLSQGVMTREDWQLLKPETIQAGLYEGRYIATYSPSNGVRKGFIWDPANPGGLFFIDFGWDALYFDDLQDALYLLDGVNIKKWDTGAALTTTFKSKLFRAPRPTPAFACAEVQADGYPVTLKLYCDGALKHTQTVASRNPFRLPSGFRASDHQVEIATAYPVQSVALAHAMQELGQV